MRDGEREQLVMSLDARASTSRTAAVPGTQRAGIKAVQTVAAEGWHGGLDKKAQKRGVRDARSG